jgi:hypothetical protein
MVIAIEAAAAAAAVMTAITESTMTEESTMILATRVILGETFNVLLDSPSFAVLVMLDEMIRLMDEMIRLMDARIRLMDLSDRTKIGSNRIWQDDGVGSTPGPYQTQHHIIAFARDDAACCCLS